MESFHSLAGMPRSGWIFPSSDAKCGHVVSIAKAFRKARIAAGLPESLCLCTARHGVGTELGAVMSLKEVMDILGHSDSRTALGYQHPSTANVQARLNEARAAGLRHTELDAELEQPPQGMIN